MSDTSNRGRILFLVMTNRPDKLDVDLKRAGRLDRKIPFLYSQTPEEVEQRREGAGAQEQDRDRRRFRVDPRQFLHEARRLQQRRRRSGDPDGQRRRRAREAAATRRSAPSTSSPPPPTTFPSRDVELLEYMELLAVFEASSRRLLPAKYAATAPRSPRRPPAPAQGDRRHEHGNKPFKGRPGYWAWRVRGARGASFLRGGHGHHLRQGLVPVHDGCA